MKRNNINSILARVARCNLTGCWNWMGATNAGGYGKTSVAGKTLPYTASFMSKPSVKSQWGYS